MINHKSSVKKISLDYHKYIELMDYLQSSCSKKEYLKACRKLDKIAVEVRLSFKETCNSAVNLWFIRQADKLSRHFATKNIAVVINNVKEG